MLGSIWVNLWKGSALEGRVGGRAKEEEGSVEDEIGEEREEQGR